MLLITNVRSIGLRDKCRSSKSHDQISSWYYLGIMYLFIHFQYTEINRKNAADWAHPSSPHPAVPLDVHVNGSCCVWVCACACACACMHGEHVWVCLCLSLWVFICQVCGAKNNIHLILDQQAVNNFRFPQGWILSELLMCESNVGGSSRFRCENQTLSHLPHW